jgi:cytochrome c oxidase subunit 4
MSSHDHSTDGHDFAHPMPVSMLLSVFFALTFLTVVTVAQASLDLGSYDVLVVMLIATLKATLVGLFFMHLAWDKPFNIAIFVGSFIFVGLFVIFTLGDSEMTSDSFTPQVDEVVPMLIQSR